MEKKGEMRRWRVKGVGGGKRVSPFRKLKERKPASPEMIKKISIDNKEKNCRPREGGMRKKEENIRKGRKEVR